MTKKFGNFLLGLLWLLTITLATTFWMNIKYGFNIFSAAHWAYLSELQAYRTEIKLDFYISLIVAIIIGLVGMYMLTRPRRQMFFIDPAHMPPAPNTTTINVLPQPKQPEPEIPIKNDSPRPMVTSARPMPPTAMSTNRPRPANTATILAPRVTTAPNQKQTESPHIGEISSIMENAGYIVKPCAHIGKLTKPVVALAYDRTVWVCSENVSLADIQEALQTLIAVFDDTLGDTANDMFVHGCIVNSPDESQDPALISTFKTIDEFQEFIKSHPNTKPDDYDAELFDAISTYIGTVTNYIGKQ